jgi:hypothetical protein
MAIQQIIIGTDTNDFPYPFRTDEPQARMSMIFLASEIGVAGSILGVAFYVSSAPGNAVDNFKIRLQETTLNSWPAADFENAGWADNYTANGVLPTDGDWYEFTLDTPFAYGGSDNLAIDISFDNATASFPGLCYYSNFGTNKTLVAEGNTGLDPTTWISGPPPNPSIQRIFEFANTRFTIDVTEVVAHPDLDQIIRQDFYATLEASDPITLQAENAQYSLNINGATRISATVRGLDQAGDIGTKIATGNAVLSLYESLIWLESGVPISNDFLLAQAPIDNENPSTTTIGVDSASIVLSATTDSGSWEPDSDPLNLDGLVTFTTERTLRDWNLATMSALLIPGQQVEFQTDSFVIGELRASFSDGGRQRSCFIREAVSSIETEENPDPFYNCAVDVGLLDDDPGFPYSYSDTLDSDRCQSVVREYVPPPGGETCRLGLSYIFEIDTTRTIRATLSGFSGNAILKLMGFQSPVPSFVIALDQRTGPSPLEVTASLDSGGYSITIFEEPAGTCVTRTKTFDLEIDSI